MQQLQPITWCFDENLEQAKEKIRRTCQKIDILFLARTSKMLWTWSLKWGTNVANTKTRKTYILDYLEKYRTLTFQTSRDNVVISRLLPSNFKYWSAQQTIDQKLTLLLYDQLCVNQIYLTTLRYQLYSFMVPPIEKVFNALIYQSILTQIWLFLNNVKNDKSVSFLSYECF